MKVPTILEADMALRPLYVKDGETLEQAKRREEIEAPYGRCGDRVEHGQYPGCREPLVGDDWLVCPDYPDCCRP